MAGPLAAGAQSPPVDSGWGAAFYSGSKRLLLYGLVRQQPAGSADYAAALARSIGLANRSGVTLLDRDLGVAPLLRYDQNINGGSPNDSFTLDGLEFLEFRVPEERTAKEGYVLGATGDAGIELAFGERNLATLDLRGSFAYSPEHEISKRDLSLTACAESYVAAWTWVESCAATYRSYRDLGETRRTTASVGVARTFASPLGLHEGTATLRYVFADSYEKPVLALDLVTARPGLGSLSLGLELSETVPDTNSTVLRATAGLARPLWGRPVSLRFGYTRQEGSEFFGEARTDEIYSIDLTRPLTDRITLAAGTAIRQSSIEFYEQTDYRLTISFEGWEF